jgi:hypothetical protein
MKTLTTFTIFILMCAVLIFTGSCATTPSAENFDLHKKDIKSLAVLPLVIGNKHGRVSGRKDEIKAFAVYWQSHFNSEFKTRIPLREDIEVKYCGEDFDIQVQQDADYGKIMDELGVDAVLGFSLESYDEFTPRESIMKDIGTLIGLGSSDPLLNPTHSDLKVRLHCYYLHKEDWAPKADIRIYNVEYEGVEDQRQRMMDGLLEFIYSKWPLSKYYVVKKP